MTYIIAEPCIDIKDRSCVDVCPVDCIHEAERILVIVDIARVEPHEVVDSWPDVPILGYTNHTDTAGLRAAHAAGFDHVLVKSALVERASALVTELTTLE